ncbi:MAG TPA: hypothetical protein VKA48_10440 [Gammaproteobacteria bacterium]|nr:hypothetical protein [Gammaproteobacteria bacterium]
MNPHQRKKFREVEEAYGMPFWDAVKMLSGRGLAKAHVAELVGYSPRGFSLLLRSESAPKGIPWAPLGERLAANQRGHTKPEEVVRNVRAGVQRTQGFWVEHQGRCIPLSELARETGIGLETLRRRWKKGLRGDALVAPSMPRQERGRRGMAVRMENSKERRRE